MDLSVSEARDLVEKCMRAAGYDQDEADIVADHLIDSELRGVAFGGLARALSVLERTVDPAHPRSPITLVRETPVSATLNGGDQVGYLVGRRATEIAIAKAHAAGVATVGAFNTWYTGMFSYYLEMVTGAGLVGMIAGSAPQKVAPHGGTEGRFGTNPIAFGFPSASSPVIWDIGTSTIMAGEVALHRRLNEPLPEGTAFDSSGRPTRDPVAATTGAFTVWGGHKGSGLALVVQLLGMMAGAAADPPGLTDCGFFVLAVDPAALTPADDFRRRVTDYADSVRATRPVEGGASVRVPFDRSLAERSRRLTQDSIGVPEQIYRSLLQWSGESSGE